MSRLIEEYGISVLNRQLSPGKTIAQGVVLDVDKDALKVIKESLQDQEMELAIVWVTTKGRVKNLLEKAVRSRYTNSVEPIIDLMKSKLVPLDKAAAALKKHWKNLCDPRFREILGKALSENAFVFDLCHFPVHVDFLNSTWRKEKAVHVGTTDSFLDWMVHKNPDYLRWQWQLQNEAVIREMKKEGNESTTEVSLRFVRIADAAKPGMDGIIRPLLMHRAPARFFQSDVVKWVIQHKWHKIWDKRVKWALVQHAAFLVCFTAYILVVGRCGDLSEANLLEQILSTILVAGIAAYGGIQFREELNQLKNSVKDGKEYPRLDQLDQWDQLHRFDQWDQQGLSARLSLWRSEQLYQLGLWWSGVSYYFRSRWNVLDLVSSTLILTVIPAFHCIELFRSGYQKLLSVSASVGVIMVYVKVQSVPLTAFKSTACLFQVWYHAQAFQSTGALVLMIDYIFQDAVYFLGLAFIVLCGFAFALSFLLRHAASDYPHLSVTDNVSNSTDSEKAKDIEENREKARDAFGDIFRSVETLFFALLGDFDRDVNLFSFCCLSPD